MNPMAGEMRNMAAEIRNTAEEPVAKGRTETAAAIPAAGEAVEPPIEGITTTAAAAVVVTVAAELRNHQEQLPSRYLG